MADLVIVTLPDPAWGSPRLGRIIAGTEGGSWGAYAFLVGTPWEPLIPLVSAALLDAALRGHATPLLRVLGPPPRALARRLPLESSQCAQRLVCVNAAPGCVPGPGAPLCWEPEGMPLDLMAQLTAAWRDNIVVVRVGE